MLEKNPDGEDAFIEANPPDLVVEVDRTRIDRDKPEKYARIGVSEMWRIDFNQGRRTFTINILDLEAPKPVRIKESRILPNLTASSLNDIYRTAALGDRDDLKDLLHQELTTSIETTSAPEDDGPAFRSMESPPSAMPTP